MTGLWWRGHSCPLWRDSSRHFSARFRSCNCSFLEIALALLLGATTCAAQQPPEIKQPHNPSTLTAQWLDSPDPRLQAWAIYLIRRNNLEDFSTRLEQILLSPLPDGVREQDWNDVQLAALDAVIQMNASLPAFGLHDLADRFPTEVLILAAKSPGENSSILLNLFDRAENYEAYVAVGNLLVIYPSPQFVRRLMASLYIHLYAALYDFGVNPGSPGGGWAADTGLIPDLPKKGWPPVGRYELMESSEGAVLLSPGNHPIYYHRTETNIYADRGFRFLGETSGHSRNDRAQEYLAETLGFTPNAFPLQIDRNLALFWINSEALKKGIKDSVIQQRQIFHAIAAEFVRRGLLDANEARSLQPRILLSLSDCRDRNHDPLPDMHSTAIELGIDLVP